MHVVAHFEPFDESSEDRRAAPRLLLSLGTSLLPCSSSVTILNLSTTGLLLDTSTELAIGEVIRVQLPEMGAAAATVVWRDGSSYGCAFEQPLSKAGLSAALLRSRPASPPREGALETGGSLPGGALRRLAQGAVGSVVAAGLIGLALTLSWAGVAILGAALALVVLWGFAVLDSTFDLNR
jgi:hypothetical protein